ncbi:non-ribosomal peptide synthetase component E (peptide arylation enzyme) [Virgibacillus natechei]|uniref:Non-ribosomal peptide synthetase component E (Peptide arylation enzyme) n=1 Tax=Virgibacillus natechei TaxID=1216297 RepID=A0ABS4IIK9_9BACI|nr:non-ribosomal peptide synthetase component E (peptide arylation enzyme) [Virgibacillus natechei]
MKLFEVAHSRAGDKGDIVNLSLIPYEETDYDWLREKVTPEAVKNHLQDIIKGDVVRYELPNINAFNFVCYQSLLGGVTTSLAMDTHGKTLSSALLEMEIE